MIKKDFEVGISVIICCYNSSQRLPETLNHLYNQAIPNTFSYEIIIVDNGSKDLTSDIAAQQKSNFEEKIMRFLIIQEPKAGKSFALKTGIDHATFKYILICDDDNWLNNKYLINSFNLISSNRLIGGLGGRSIAVSDIILPDFFAINKHKYAVGSQCDTSGYVIDKNYIWGAGMLFRKADYLRVYSKYPPLLQGPEKDLLTRGEDVEFCMRLIFMGYSLYYSEDLLFHHYIPGERLTYSYTETFFKENAYENLILSLYNRQIIFMKLLGYKKAIKFTKSMIRIIAKKIFALKRWDLNYECENIFLLSGIKLQKINYECKIVRKLYLQLKNKAFVNE